MAVQSLGCAHCPRPTLHGCHAPFERHPQFSAGLRGGRTLFAQYSFAHTADQNNSITVRHAPCILAEQSLVIVIPMPMHAAQVRKHHGSHHLVTHPSRYTWPQLHTWSAHMSICWASKPLAARVGGCGQHVAVAATLLLDKDVQLRRVPASED
jgi:hypothetical protein